VAIFLDRSVKYDNATNRFVGDDQANRLLSEASREPWRM
jgi:hypothetical protein